MREREGGESSAAPLKIRATGFAGHSSAKPKNGIIIFRLAFSISPVPDLRGWHHRSGVVQFLSFGQKDSHLPSKAAECRHDSKEIL